MIMELFRLHQPHPHQGHSLPSAVIAWEFTWQRSDEHEEFKSRFGPILRDWERRLGWRHEDAAQNGPDESLA
jgi:hypothetical protein